MVAANKSFSLSEAFLDAKSDYRASKQTRFTPQLRGVNPSGSGADYHYRSESAYLHMIERARDIERNDPIVGSGIRRLTSNVVQEGFTPDPDTNSADLDARLKDLWYEWASEPDLCHSEQEFDFFQLERLAFSSIIRDGDFFTLLLKDQSLQCVEGHRPRTPRRTDRNVVHGINLDKRAKRKEVWLSKEDLSPYQTVSRVRDIERYAFRGADGFRQVLQCYFPRRFSQRRGITALAPVTDTAGMHDDVQYAAMVKQQLSALIVLLEEQDPNAPVQIGAPGIGSQPNAGELRDGLQGTLAKLGAGIHYRAPKGTKVSGFTPQIPGEAFIEHSMLLMTFIAINLDLPLQVLLLDPTKTNFSGWRGAVEEARKRYREMQLDLVSQFHRPVYRWLVRRWIQKDVLAAQYAAESGVSPLKHKWKRPSWPYIEPLKDSQSDNLQQERFLNSPTRIQSARGREWEEVAPEIVRDKGLLISLAIEKADEINAKFPDANVTWREVLGPGLTVASPAIVTESGQKEEAAA